MNQYITPDAFNRSIEMAFNSSFNIDTAIQRLKKILAAMPSDRLYCARHNGWISFYKLVGGKQKYLSKKTTEIYLLARRQYLLLQLNILELSKYHDGKSLSTRHNLISELQALINTYADGNLDISRIVMTPKQYKWFTSSFQQKRIDTTIAYKSSGGIFVRSKSERDIIHTLEAFAVPVHYEEKTAINVYPLVESLRITLEKANKLRGSLFYYKNGACDGMFQQNWSG